MTFGPTGNSSGLKGTGYKQVSLGTLNPEQQGLFSQLMGGLQPGLGEGLSQLGKMAAGDQSQFQQMEAPAMRQFAGLQGSLASKFSGMGSGGRRSSGFQNTMGEAGAGLAESLASRRMDFQRDAIQQLLGLSKDLLSRDTFDTFLMPQQNKIPLWRKLLAGGSSALGGGAGFLLGGPGGAALGSQIGSSLGQAFL